MCSQLMLALSLVAANDPYDFKELTVESETPAAVRSDSAGAALYDFAKDAVGWLEIESPTGGAYEVTLGELVNRDGLVTNPYPNAWITCERVRGVASSGKFRVPLPKKKLNTTGWDPKAPSILLPERIGVVAPFRYVSAQTLPVGAKLCRQTVSYPMDFSSSSFVSENSDLDRLYEFCRFSMKATSFCGYYVDGDRERTPYEADAYLNQLSHYAVDSDYSLARKTHEYLLAHPTWPTEWKQFSIMMAWTDWMWSGDARSIAKFYDLLKSEKLNPGVEVRPDGLLVTSWKTRGGPTRSRDIIDWPECERDGFVMNSVNAVVNAFRYRNLLQMAEIAQALDKTTDADDFKRQAARVYESYNRVFYDASRGLYVDGEGVTHAALHANAAALAMGLVPKARQTQVADFLEAKGMACSTYFAQFLLEALYVAGRDTAAMKLMLNSGPRGWLQMMDRFGSTVTLESWDFDVKPNQDLNHAWGAVPLNIIVRYVLGVEPTKPGFREYRVNPRPSGLKTFRGTVPTPRGPITVAFRNGHRLPEKSFVVSAEPGYNAWPMIQATGNDLLCAYSRDSARPADGHGISTGTRDSYLRVSSDGGRTWSEERILAADPRVGEVNEGIGRDSTGATLLWVRCWGGAKRHELYRTPDGVRIEKIASLVPDPLPMQITDIVSVKGLGLVSPWFAGSYRNDGKNSWGLLVSADDGRTWTQRTIEANLSVKDWVTEPSLVNLGDGRLIIIGRCERRLGNLFQVTSTDNGKTWLKSRTNISDVLESTPSLLYDQSSDVLTLYYYHRGARQLKRRQVRARQVLDSPESWPAPEVLETGFESRPFDAGNVNATRQGPVDYCAWYTGNPSNATVVVTSGN